MPTILMTTDQPFPIIAEGFVARRQPGRDTQPIAAGPRVVSCGDGSLLCSYMVTAALGTNDFVLKLARSLDGGQSWRDCGPVWPDLRGWSLFASLSRDPAGRLFLFGTRYKIDQPGESFWSDATQGLKQNELLWSTSSDDGHRWSVPQIIPMPIPGAAEAPAPLVITKSGRWLAPYSPYNTFDPAIRVDRHQVVVVYSDDEGRSWRHTSMLRFSDPQSTGAEAWAVELSDGTLLGAGWNIAPSGAPDHPNAYAISRDAGSTWSATRSTGILGQSTALTALPDGRALFVYNQRRHGPPGVWLAVVRPTATDFGIEQHGSAWLAATATQAATSGEHAEWTDFAFGEPAAAVLPDGSVLVVLWCIQPDGQGIRWVRVKL